MRTKVVCGGFNLDQEGVSDGRDEGLSGRTAKLLRQIDKRMHDSSVLELSESTCGGGLAQ
jgi:hypothetical protein